MRGLGTFMADVIMNSQADGPARKKIKAHGGNDYPVMPNIFNNQIFYGFPPSLITRLRYCDIKNKTPSVAVNHHVFNMNSLFDPDETATGHQPMYRDQFALIYNKYTVLGSKITVRYVNQAATAIPAVVGIAMGDDSTFDTNLIVMMEQPKSHWKLLGLNTGGGDTITLTNTYGVTEDEGINGYAGSSDVRTAMGSNPTERYCASAWCSSSDSATNTNITYTVEIEYTVLFSELADISTS